MWQILGLSLLLAVSIWRGAISHTLCHLPISVKATNFDDRTWCFEFWLNRYQTLIGAGAAIVAAIAAWKASNSQSNLTRHARFLQTMVDLQKMMMGSVAPYAHFLLSCSIDILEQKCLDEQVDKISRQAYLRRRMGNMAPFTSAWNEFNEVALRTPMKEGLEEAFTAFRESVARIINISIIITNIASEIVDEWDDDDEAACQVRKNLSAFRANSASARASAEEAWEAFRVELSRELDRARNIERKFRQDLEPT